jgi:hypothetical protein
MGLLTQFRRRSVFASFGVAAAVVVASVVLAYVKARGYS